MVSEQHPWASQDLTYVPLAGTGGQAGWPLNSGYGNVTVLTPRESGLALSYEFNP